MSRSTMTIFLAALISLFVPLVAAAPTSDLETRGSSYSGRGTYFAVGLGACGVTNVDSDYIVALSTADYGSGQHCGKVCTLELLMRP